VDRALDAVFATKVDFKKSREFDYDANAASKSNSSTIRLRCRCGRDLRQQY